MPNGFTAGDHFWVRGRSSAGRGRQTLLQARILTDFFQARRCYCRYIAILTTIRHPTKTLRIDIKALTVESPNLVSQLGPAFEKYNEEQFTTVKLPGSSQLVSLSPRNAVGSQLTPCKVIVSSHNSLPDGRYYDVENSSSFAIDHTTQVIREAEHISYKR
jgi:hypothetical protein